MRRPGIAIALMLAPAVGGLGLLFVGGLAIGLLRSIGVSPLAGRVDLGLDAYRRVMEVPGLGASVLATLWVATAATAISTVAGVAGALAVRRWLGGRGGRLVPVLFQLGLTVPHVVAAAGFALLLAQSGLLARAAFGVGLIDGPAGFPALTQDPGGIGMIAAYVWKEVPFVGAVTLALLATLGDEPEAVARGLGATRWQAFRHVTLPLLAPGVASAAAVVFAFTLGAYEIPAVLGASHPKLLPVLAVELFTSGDIADRPAAIALSLLTAVAAVLAVLGLGGLARVARRMP